MPQSLLLPARPPGGPRYKAGVTGRERSPGSPRMNEEDKKILFGQTAANTAKVQLLRAGGEVEPVLASSLANDPDLVASGY